MISEKNFYKGDGLTMFEGGYVLPYLAWFYESKHVCYEIRAYEGLNQYVYLMNQKESDKEYYHKAIIEKFKI